MYPSDTLGILDFSISPSRTVELIDSANVMLFGLEMPYDSIRIDSVAHVPQGMTWACQSGLQNCLILPDSFRLFRYCLEFTIDINAQNTSLPLYDTLVVHISNFLDVLPGVVFGKRERRVLYYHIDAPVEGLDDTGNQDALFSMEAYPNPASDFLTVEYTLSQADAISLEVGNLLGQTVWIQNFGIKSMGKHKATADISRLPPGIYLISMMQNGERFTRKFVKQRL